MKPNPLSSLNILILPAGIGSSGCSIFSLEPMDTVHNSEGRNLPSPHGRLSHADAPGLWYPRHMRSAIWMGIFIGSTIGGFIPLIWDDDMLSYSGVLFSGIGAFVGLWFGLRVDD